MTDLQLSIIILIVFILVGLYLGYKIIKCINDVEKQNDNANSY